MPCLKSQKKAVEPEMPKFLKVETRSGVNFINVQDIHWIEEKEDSTYDVIYTVPGQPNTNHVLVSKTELSVSLWTLQQIANR